MKQQSIKDFTAPVLTAQIPRDVDNFTLPVHRKGIRAWFQGWRVLRINCQTESVIVIQMT